MAGMSSQQATRIIAAYVARVDEIQKQQQDALNVSALKSIARELGLNEHDLAHADRTAQEHLQRGQGYLTHGLLDDAIGELRSAVVLRPLDPATVLALAEGFAARWKALGRDDDREEADQLARQALQLDPSLQEAYRLRRDLSSHASTQTASSSPSSSSRSPWGVWVGLVLVVLGTLLAGVFWAGTAEVAPLVATTSPATEAEVVGVGVGEVAGEMAVRPVGLSSLPGMLLETRTVKLSEYDGSWSFEAKGFCGTPRIGC